MKLFTLLLVLLLSAGSVEAKQKLPVWEYICNYDPTTGYIQCIYVDTKAKKPKKGAKK